MRDGAFELWSLREFGCTLALKLPSAASAAGTVKRPLVVVVGVVTQLYQGFAVSSSVRWSALLSRL